MFLDTLLPVALAFLVVTASPGPAVIAAALVTMQRGRRDGLLFGLGLSLGLGVWGVVAATGLGVLLESSAQALVALKIIGGLYLLWLVFQHFAAETDDNDQHHGPRFQSVWQAIPIIAVTDLAFSLDSVTTAIALSNDVLVILLEGAIGVLTLRFMAGLFIRWLEEFEHLEDAGFVTVAVVGIRLLVRVINPDLVPPEWAMVGIIALLFTWGFSERTAAVLESEAEIAETPTAVNLPTFAATETPNASEPSQSPAALVPDREEG